MIFKLVDEDLKSFEKYILIIIKGVLQSLIDEQIDIEDAENIIFSPKIVEKLHTYKVNEKIINIVELGCELEDIESLLPNILEQEIEKLFIKTIYLLNNDYN